MAKQATATATGAGGLNWDGLMGMLGGFMKKPENQRMIMEMVRPMTQKFDPRTGKMVGGVGTGMLDAGSALINREEVGKTAAAQAQREQLYNQQRLAQQQEILKLMAGQNKASQAPTSQLGWGFGIGGQQFPDGTSDRLAAPTETEQQRRYKMAQGGY